MNSENAIQRFVLNLEKQGLNPDYALAGLAHLKPLNYWEYTQVETLLSLQNPRTHFKDETVFILYHQLTELVFKLMLHEIEQLSTSGFSTQLWLEKTDRLIRYTQLLLNSFDIMKYGMNYDEYAQFRTSLSPASGFQSAQYRKIELHCTSLLNLVHVSKRKTLSSKSLVEELFPFLYWYEAGTHPQSGKKSATLQQFETKYQMELQLLAKQKSGQTLDCLLAQAPDVSADLVHKLREFDRLFNIDWPLVHLQTAKHYLESKDQSKAATGGSAWTTYLHPSYQKRTFFPLLWSQEELTHWGS
ncbi:MAG: tryptophan 2,3-dioxygenase [Bacteroidetes bacterium]|nr:MAG: tryptophan 2,3-dioxygenase [Bacteroidota bacterium]